MFEQWTFFAWCKFQALSNPDGSPGAILLTTVDGCNNLKQPETDGARRSGKSWDLISGFDQEAAIVVTARQVSLKMETEGTKLDEEIYYPRLAEFDPIRWLDKSLIQICSRFGDYQKDSPSSFILSPRFSIFPQFIFHLRRSQFVQVFNNSPDETAYFRMVLNRESVSNSVMMIQPSLISYSFHSGPVPVLLDVAAIAADRILLLDSYFTMVVFHGSTIAQWRKAGYHNQPEHEVAIFLLVATGQWPHIDKRIMRQKLIGRTIPKVHNHLTQTFHFGLVEQCLVKAFAQLLRAPKDDVEGIINERFPVPRLVICDQHGSQARFLLAKLNPSATYNSDAPPVPGGDVIFTDDVSFEFVKGEGYAPFLKSSSIGLQCQYWHGTFCSDSPGVTRIF
ncbi:hypothetical protein RJ639_006540 [Escallonia herrerae]|uniref:Protein transport protein SEC23 n=1 Tax=Escallonia herrerae TaxID=1293975 RepID=A0AA89AU82_9ASTE|nr:hypothetical protein RJ639_006540 [Escallonia herrerae]